MDSMTASGCEQTENSAKLDQIISACVSGRWANFEDIGYGG